jgi:hypothetical protein
MPAPKIHYHIDRATVKRLADRLWFRIPKSGPPEGMMRFADAIVVRTLKQCLRKPREEKETAE